MSNSRDATGNGFSLGVLIIGSLYWDCSSIREKWRRQRLDLDHKQYARVPIRYGRCSQSRGKSYTMVFSSGLDESDFGRAIVIPCKSQDVVMEAKHLWDAERNGNGDNDVSTGWGCVGLLLNPDSQVPNEQLNRWNKLVRDKPCYGQMKSAEGECMAVSRNGFLDIPWPKLVDDSPLRLHALLATATNPTIVCGRYPSAREIGNAWLKLQGLEKKHICYFWNPRLFMGHVDKGFQPGVFVRSEPGFS